MEHKSVKYHWISYVKAIQITFKQHSQQYKMQNSDCNVATNSYG